MKKISIFLLIIFMLLPTHSISGTKVYGDFKNVKYVRNYDGDTITVTIPGVHPLFGENINIRVKGIDTPEKRSRCKTISGKKNEKNLANKAQSFVQDIMNSATNIDLLNTSRGKYFRIVADVIVKTRYIESINVADMLIKSSLAVPYSGGTKVKDWCK